jgi:DNA-binding response OmpR family regulator
MEQDLSRRLIWLLGEGAQGTRIESALAEAGSACERFETIEGLDESVEHAQPDLVLVGAATLGESGQLERVIERLRRPPSSGVPIVVVTDDGSIEMRQRMFRAGVDDFVLEPMVTSELLTRVRSQLMLNGPMLKADRLDRPVRGDRPGRGDGQAGDAPLSILVADAESMIQRVLRSAFERHGWFVTTTSDGRDAVQLFGESEFDLVVFDLNLPFKNGFELLSELGGAAVAQRPHMIVLSAERQHDSVLRAFELGADDFMSKPVNPDILIARIERLVRPDGGARIHG